jgi:oligo-1,6-glucosidase
MRREAFAGRDIVTVGEASATSLDEARIFSNPDGSELDMVFQFEHMDLDGGETFKWTDRTIPVRALKEVMTKWQLGLAGQGWNGLFWNNHDQPRMVSRLGDEGALRERSAKMLATCLHLMQGTPFIYQGEELGMTSMVFTDKHQLRDSESLNAYDRYVNSGEILHTDMLRYISLKSRDSGRTPMQWSNSPNAGFTTGNPWMPINPNYVNINAAEQEGRPDSVLSFYRELIALRKAHPVIVHGSYEVFHMEHPEVFAYFRKSEEETLYVCCNFSKEAAAFPLPEGYENAQVLLSNLPDSRYRSEKVLAPFEALVLKKQ